MLGRVLDVLYPRRCAGCGIGSWPFCDACRRELVALGPPWCERCGAPAAADVRWCPSCPPGPLDRSRAPFLFEGPARSAIHRLKFGGVRGVAEALGRAMALVAPGSPELVTWVPLSRRRLAERGFDQARALATAVARELGLPLRGLLLRTGGVAGTQARRAGEERRRAMLGRFVAAAVPPRHVLLVDDVLTTGATAAACAGALAAEGADDVSLLVAARSVRPAGPPASRGPAARARALAPSAPRTPEAILARGSRSGLWLPGEPLPGSRCQPRAKRPT